MKGRGKGRQVTGDEWRLHTRGRTMKGRGREISGGYTPEEEQMKGRGREISGGYTPEEEQMKGRGRGDK
ncbi:hypothetical protein RRG08_047968 [Elysia crispata]|uniref:Uncharacterized protein n=1 Tax=Elysia crispata TaxID=231223 RepID=A0AAE0ZUR6_9GAST|nr:hypothetical protein RRG08_047968 [Elysia crispata]